jgi:hypothetical protein
VLLGLAGADGSWRLVSSEINPSWSVWRVDAHIDAVPRHGHDTVARGAALIFDVSQLGTHLASQPAPAVPGRAG